jgi:hypothetical protein
VLGQVLEELYGSEFLDSMKRRDATLAPIYAEAWKWADDFSDEEKKEKFIKVLEGGASLLV